MRYATWALIGAFYLIGVLMGGSLLHRGSTMDGASAGALGGAAVLLLMLPSFILWQERCLSRADARARAALSTITDAFEREIAAMDQRNQAVLQSMSIELGSALARVDAAEDALARMNQGPRARRAVASVSIPRID